MQPDPLAALRDIHLPPAVSWWPPAIGWWLLLLITVSLVAAAVCWMRKRKARQDKSVVYSRRDIVDAAMLEFAQLQAAIQNGGNVKTVVTALSRLLRRSAVQLAEKPSDVAGLTGEAWLLWLDAQWHADGFCAGVGRQLIEAPYRPEGDLDIEAVCIVCRDWLEAQR